MSSPALANGPESGEMNPSLTTDPRLLLAPADSSRRAPPLQPATTKAVATMAVPDQIGLTAAVWFGFLTGTTPQLLMECHGRDTGDHRTGSDLMPFWKFERRRTGSAAG